MSTRIEKSNLEHVMILNMSVLDVTMLKICDYYVQYINQLINQEFINKSTKQSINQSSYSKFVYPTTLLLSNPSKLSSSSRESSVSYSQIA